MLQKKFWIVMAMGIAVMVLLCVCMNRRHSPCQSQTNAKQGTITDRNGLSLDTTVVPGIEKFYDEGLKINMELSIDSELQKFGEELIEGKVGSIVAIEPSTGEVLCMVSTPPFNRCIMGQYLPGGVFKVVNSLVLLSEGIITPQTYYPCEDGFRYNGIRIGCHHHASPLLLKDALRTSCNGYFCHGYLDMLGNEKYGSVERAFTVWRENVISMGFGNQLGIDLPNERRGMIPSTEYYNSLFNGHWSGLAILNNAIGLGEIVTTPLQLANLAAIIANRGYYYIPHVVKRIQGKEIDEKFTSVHSAKASQEAYETVIDAMRASVMNGTCKKLADLSIEACGISGTISSKDYNHSVFIGFAPVDTPQIAVAVYVEDIGHGTKTGTTTGGHIMEKYLAK